MKGGERGIGTGTVRGKLGRKDGDGDGDGDGVKDCSKPLVLRIMNINVILFNANYLGQTTNTPRYTLIKDSVMKTVKDKQLQKSRQVHSVFVLHEPWEWYDKCNRRERNQGMLMLRW